MAVSNDVKGNEDDGIPFGFYAGIGQAMLALMPELVSNTDGKLMIMEPQVTLGKTLMHNVRNTESGKPVIIGGMVTIHVMLPMTYYDTDGNVRTDYDYVKESEL